MIEKTPLEDWVRQKIGLEAPKLSREELERYQLAAFSKTLAFVKNNSPFYRELLAGIQADGIETLSAIADIPFTWPDDIKLHGSKLVCVPQEEISRIVSLNTSGTMDLPKRIYFTQEDQELTTDFFAVGMTTFTRASDRVLILLPGIRPGSIGDLLKIGLGRMGAEGIIYGVVDDPQKVEQIILNEGINLIVGIPQQVLALSIMAESDKIKEQGLLKAVLLSTDYVSNAAVRRIRARWGSEVYEHYGMTEMGLGGGVFCQARTGYHLREADMLFEIVDPVSGRPVADGHFGEVVFTTLTRKGMPLIRYRTGDISRFLTEPCGCGTVLKTMDKVQCRIASSVALEDGFTLTISALEEILFAIDGIVDFDAVLTVEDNINCLNIHINQGLNTQGTAELILNAVLKSELGGCILNKKLQVKIGQQLAKELDSKAIKKRKIVDERMVTR